MLPAISLLVYALAVARVTRLINADRITEAPREWLIERIWLRRWAPLYPQHTAAGVLRTKIQQMRAEGVEAPLLAYLIECPWCASVYVGAVAAPLVFFLGDSPWLLVPALGLALSQFAGMASKYGE